MFGVAFTIPGLGWPVYWYGILISLAAAAGIMLSWQRGKRFSWNADYVIDLCLVVIPLAVVGARLYYVVFDWENVYQGNILNIFNLREGGLAIYGTIIGGVVGVLIFAKWKKTPILRILDVVAPGVILGQAIGRWGNYFNQEVYGQVVTDPAWQFFPAAVWVGGEWYMALFFYESILNLLICGFLIWYDRKQSRPGSVFLFYVLLYGLVRFFLEPLRVDQYILYFGGMAISQILSALLVLGAAAGLIAVFRGKKPEDIYDPGLAILGVNDKTETQDSQMETQHQPETSIDSQPEENQPEEPNTGRE